MSAEFLLLYQAIVSDNQTLYSELRNSNTNVGPLLKETVKHSEDTLLHVAAKWKRHNIAGIILDLEPSLLSAINAEGETPLHVAASVGSDDVTRVIIDRCGQIEAAEIGESILRKKTEKQEDTALHKAVRNGHLQLVEMLIGKDPGLTKLENKEGDSPLFMAVETMQSEIARSILTVSDCSFKGRKNVNALHAAIAHYHMTLDEIFSTLALEIIEHLAEERQAIEVIEQQDDNFGWTPLHYAAHMNATQAIQLLLFADHSVAYIKDNNGMTALHIAAKQGHVGAVEQLLRTCPEICGILDNNGQNFFHVAVKSGVVRVVRFVLGKRHPLLIDILLYLCFPNTLQFVHPYFGGYDLQLFAGDLLNMQDYQGNTVLHLAALQEEYYFILFLLTMDHRLSKSITNSDGRTVFDVMGRWGYRPSPWKVIRYAILSSGGAPGSEELLRSQSNKLQIKIGEELEGIGSMRQINLVVATIIATVSFTAALSVPGGFKNDGTDEGTAALAQKSDFHKFVIFNAIAFAFSVTSIFMSRYDRRLKVLFEIFTSVLTHGATLAMVVAFIYGTSAVLRHSEAELATYVKHIIWVCLSIIFFAERLSQSLSFKDALFK